MVCENNVAGGAKKFHLRQLVVSLVVNHRQNYCNDSFGHCLLYIHIAFTAIKSSWPATLIKEVKLFWLLVNGCGLFKRNNITLRHR